MAIEITREQRDAIYEEILTEISGSGDVWLDMQSGNYDGARRTRHRYANAMRLLDDIGWEPEQDGERFELTMEAADLARALGSLNDNARAMLHDQIVRPLEEADVAKRALIAQTAYGDVLAQIAQSGSAERGERFGG